MDKGNLCFTCCRPIEAGDETVEMKNAIYHRTCYYTQADPLEYRLGRGTLQPCVIMRGDGRISLFLHHFSHPVYNRNQPILTAHIIAQAAPIVTALNEGVMSQDEARAELDKIL